MAQSLDIRPLSAHCGAEISGVDLADLSQEGLATIRATLAERGVVFLHDQHLTPEQHIAFARRWGDIAISRFIPKDSRYPEVAEVLKDETQTTNIGGAWHTDDSYAQEPAMGSILLARQIPPKGGDTLFSNLYAVYDSLSDGLKQSLAKLRAVHSSDHVFGARGRYANTDIRNVLEGQEAQSFAVHPVVITHPESGRKALYVNPAFTLRFEGWTVDQSRPLLHRLFAQAIRPEFICTLKWRQGSLAIWDNRSTWHLARNDYHGYRRLMHRITIAGGALSG